MSADERDRNDPAYTTAGTTGAAGAAHGAAGRRGTGGDGRGPALHDDRSVPQLLRELSSEGADLVRQEVALAKAEMSEKLSVFQRNLIVMATGGAFLLTALLFALWAVNSGVTALLAQVLDLEVAVWLSPLLLAAILAAVGWGMVQKAKDALREEGVTPHATKTTLQEDARWARARAREAKEDIRHG